MQRDRSKPKAYLESLNESVRIQKFSREKSDRKCENSRLVSAILSNFARALRVRMPEGPANFVLPEAITESTNYLSTLTKNW